MLIRKMYNRSYTYQTTQLILTSSVMARKSTDKHKAPLNNYPGWSVGMSVGLVRLKPNLTNESMSFTDLKVTSGYKKH